MEDDNTDMTRKLVESLNAIPAISEYRSTVKKQYYNFARRLKLLIPMFEEIHDSNEPLPLDVFEPLSLLKLALDSAMEMLQFGSEGSKIYLVLERDQLMRRFQELTAELEHVLSAIPYEKLDISDEVKEQVELVITQFKRAKGRVELPDTELYNDLVSIYNEPNNSVVDPNVMRRLVEKLQLTQISDHTEESLALLEMVDSMGGNPDENIEKMSMLLKKIKEFVLAENPNLDSPVQELFNRSGHGGQTFIGEGNQKPRSGHGEQTFIGEGDQKPLVIPDDFRCPISLELMRNPVIVSSGQTYERSCIKKWLEAGHLTCPKTQQAISSTSLTPNYVLRSLISQWCEANGVKPPQRPGRSQSNKRSVCSTSPMVYPPYYPQQHSHYDYVSAPVFASVSNDQLKYMNCIRHHLYEDRQFMIKSWEHHHMDTSKLKQLFCVPETPFSYQYKGYPLNIPHEQLAKMLGLGPDPTHSGGATSQAGAPSEAAGTGEGGGGP